MTKCITECEIRDYNDKAIGYEALVTYTGLKQVRYKMKNDMLYPDTVLKFMREAEVSTRVTEFGVVTHYTIKRR